MSGFNYRAREGHDSSIDVGSKMSSSFNYRAREGHDVPSFLDSVCSAVSTTVPAKGTTLEMVEPCQ